jgi:hypothetical protein
MNIEMNYTWFRRRTPPKRRGVYLTKSLYAGNPKLTWWRAWDGKNWRYGIPATDTEGNVVNVCPDYQDASYNGIIGYHVEIQWTGIAK